MRTADPFTTREAPMPIVVGCPRSGTTLLRLMLDAHPELAIPPETGFLPTIAGLGDGDVRTGFFSIVTGFPADAPAWRDFHLSMEELEASLAGIQPFSCAEGCRAFYRLYARNHGKPRWGDKTPLYCHYIEPIARMLPEARFVHIVRDGRDVAASLREQWFAPAREVGGLARFWSDCINKARSANLDPSRYMEVRFESLIREPEDTLRRICGFIELPFHQRMLEHHRFAADRMKEHLTRLRLDGSVVVSHEQRLVQQKATHGAPDENRIGMWRELLTPAEQEEFEREAGHLLAGLGYPRGGESVEVTSGKV